MLRLAQRALARANEDRSPDRPIQALVNNSDGWGNSYGGHLNILLGRPAWEGLMRRRLHHLAYLASYQASALVFTGQGKVGSENDRPPVSYQLSQRADFIETLLGPQTTFFRPLVNTRDEPHSDHARLHLISFDSTLAETASLLRVGVTQLILALIEADQVNPVLALDDPVAALQRWSHDPTLEAKAALASGALVTAVELQQHFLDEAIRGLARGDFEGTVPRAGEIIAIWQETLEQLARRDWPRLAGRLDWVAKLAIIQRAQSQHGFDWSAPEAKLLDHLYSGLDPEEGVYWSWAEPGMEQVVDPARIRHFMDEPPEDTRAFVRAHLLREAGADGVDQVDWDRISFRPRGERVSRTLMMPNPLAGSADPMLLQLQAAEPNHDSSR
jgi:proteasome accessory factor A